MVSIRTHKRYVITFISLMISLFAFTNVSFAQETPKKKAVATFSILGDLVKNVAGDRLELTVLVGPGSDSHVYSPSASDARKLKEADIIFENGMAFEGWMARLVKSSGTAAKVIVVSKGILPNKPDDQDHKADKHHHGHDNAVDPHAWQSVPNTKLYVANIRDALISIDPAGKTIYEDNARSYLAKLDALDKTIRDMALTIPKERRKIITSHDAFGYFAKEYGFEFISLQGISSESEPSAKDVARIIRLIKKEKISAIFIETISNQRLMEQITQQSGIQAGSKVYSDSLSDASGPASSYIGMMEHNIKAFQLTLQSSK